MRPWLEIRLEAVVSNARALAARVAPAALCAVVKANAYGHGLAHIGRALDGAGIADLTLGVFTANEGVALREAGVECPILVLGPMSDAEIGRAVRELLECAVIDELDPERLPAGAVVHVKVDTGVGRFGVDREAIARTLQRCSDAGLQVVGLYSHLANAEDLDERLTSRQLEQLLAISAPDGAQRHIAASAAAIMWPQTRLDMVRCGIALYGHWPSDAVRTAPASHGLVLERALRWFAPVAQIRAIDAGDTVGYGCEYVAQRPSTIAVLPLGYADGLPRTAGNGACSVAFGETRAPIVGRVCMNACMVDVTDVRPRPNRGDAAEIDVEDIATAAGTIAYEVLARLPESLERRYHGG